MQSAVTEAWAETHSNRMGGLSLVNGATLAFLSLLLAFLCACGSGKPAIKGGAVSSGASTSPVALRPIERPSYSIARPKKALKITFGRTKDDPLQLNGYPYFLGTFDSEGKMSGGIQIDTSDSVLDAKAIAEKGFSLIIGEQSSRGREIQEVRLEVTPGANVFYISPDRVVVPSQSPIVAANGPFVTLKFLRGDWDSANLIDWTIDCQQSGRKDSGKTSASGFLMSDVDPLPITCVVANPSKPSDGFSSVIFPFFRGGTPGLVTYTIIR
jgi:hypothetical protein